MTPVTWELEQALVLSPDNIETRVLLVCYYERLESEDETAKQMLIKHALWIIANQPDSIVSDIGLTCLHPVMHGDAYFQGEQLWKRNLQIAPQNLHVIYNAAVYVVSHDKIFAQELLSRLQKIAKANPKWDSKIRSLNTRVHQ